MALANDTKAQAALGTGNPITLSYTCGATAKLLVVYIAGATTAARGGGAPTYNTVAMTQAGTSQAGSAECNVELWYLINPSVGAAYNISVPNSGSLNLRVMAASFTGTGAALFGTPVQENATPSLTINNVPAGGMTAAVLGHGHKDPCTGRSHTVVYEQDEGAWNSNSQYGLIASLSNVTMTWTPAGADDVAMVMAAFEEVVSSITGTVAGTCAPVTGAVSGAAKVAGSVAANAAQVTAQVTGVASSVLSDWVVVPSWTLIWDADEQCEGNTWLYVNSTFNLNVRVILKSSSITADAQKIRVKLKQTDPAYTNPFEASSMYIGPRSGTTASYSTTPTQVLKGGIGNFAIGYGSGYEYSDPVTIAIDETLDYLCSFHGASQLWQTGYLDGTTNHAYYKVSATDESGDVTATSYNNDSDINSVAAVEKNDYPSTWQTALTTEPTTVTEDDVALTERASIALVDANAGSWCWISNVVYVRPTSGAITDYVYEWSAGAGTITGQIAATCAVVTGAIAGAVKVAGTVAANTAQVTGVISGAVLVSGSVEANAVQTSADVAGAVAIAGAVDVNLSPITASVASGAIVAGSIGANAGAVTAAVSGAAIVAGSVDATLSQVTGAIAGAVAITGTVDATAAATTAALSGGTSDVIRGTLSAALSPATGAVEGEVLISGGVSAIATPTTSAVAGEVLISGGVAAAVAPTTAAVTGQALISAAVAANMAQILATIEGDVLVSGSIAAIMAAASASVEGTLGAAPGAARRRFLRIPGRSFISGNILNIPGEPPVDSPDIANI